ncbi:hypothetical protein ACQEVB_04635 [Pseudonocardia sp. CA-107938]|uniref:hypothetical protein n=1 Tax=Pseudonocardia sp. CA-107938 TaxID=3240021 RepID=UPI003D93D3EB
MRSHVGRAVAAVTIVGAVISGCGGPGAPGTAAVIGDRTIPLGQVETEVEGVLGDPGAVELAQTRDEKPIDMARDVVSSRVTEGVVVPAAAAAGVVIPQAQIDSEIDSTMRAALGGVSPADQQAIAAKAEAFRGALRRAVPAQLTAQELGRKVAAHLAVTVDEVSVRDRATAEQLATALATGGPAAEAALSGPGVRKGVTYRATPDQAHPDARVDPDRAGTVLFGVPQGGVVAYQPSQANATWSVARVVARDVAAPGKDDDVAGLSQQQLLLIGLRAAQATTGTVTVNPRYGEWDPVRFGVVAAGDSAGRVLLPA